MFIYDTHLPQILSRDSYTSNVQHATEMEKLFRPSWHFVGTRSDIPREGDYLTTRLMDRPLIIWNASGRISVFANVCPDGCSELTNKTRGNAKGPHCPEHGTANGLHSVRTEMCGPLIFVSFDADAPSLEEFVGPMWDTMKSLFPDDIRDVLSLDYEIEANWKVKVENTLESYHVQAVHPKSFSHMPEAEVCNEELGPNGSSFHALEEAPTWLDRLLDRGLHRLALAERDLCYSHYIAFPHIMFAKMRLMSWIECVYPISASKHRVVLRSFYRPTVAGKLRSGLAYRFLRAWGRRFGRIVSGEDAAVIPYVQKGLACPVAPSQGLLSIREERLFHFQGFIQRETQVLRNPVPELNPA